MCGWSKCHWGTYVKNRKSEYVACDYEAGSRVLTRIRAKRIIIVSDSWPSPLLTEAVYSLDLFYASSKSSQWVLRKYSQYFLTRAQNESPSGLLVCAEKTLFFKRGLEEVEYIARSRASTIWNLYRSCSEKDFSSAHKSAALEQFVLGLCCLSCGSRTRSLSWLFVRLWLTNKLTRLSSYAGSGTRFLLSQMST